MPFAQAGHGVPGRVSSQVLRCFRSFVRSFVLPNPKSGYAIRLNASDETVLRAMQRLKLLEALKYLKESEAEIHLINGTIYSVVEFLGIGDTGRVYRVVDTDGVELIMKIFFDLGRMELEVEDRYELSRDGLPMQRVLDVDYPSGTAILEDLNGVSVQTILDHPQATRLSATFREEVRQEFYLLSAQYKYSILNELSPSNVYYDLKNRKLRLGDPW